MAPNPAQGLSNSAAARRWCTASDATRLNTQLTGRFGLTPVD